MVERDGDERLPRAIRLTCKGEFDRVFKEGKSIRVPGLTILFLPNRQGFSRIGVSVGKRRLPKAVQRNRAKRMARELFRRNKTLFGKGYDYVLIPQSEFLSHPYHQYVEWLRRALAKKVGRKAGNGSE